MPNSFAPLWSSLPPHSPVRSDFALLRPGCGSWTCSSLLLRPAPPTSARCGLRLLLHCTPPPPAPPLRSDSCTPSLRIVGRFFFFFLSRSEAAIGGQICFFRFPNFAGSVCQGWRAGCSWARPGLQLCGQTSFCESSHSGRGGEEREFVLDTFSPSFLTILIMKQACCAGCRRRPFPMKLHQWAKSTPSVKRL